MSYPLNHLTLAGVVEQSNATTTWLIKLALSNICYVQVLHYLSVIAVNKQQRIFR